jgi:hypothetical protein
MNPRRRSILVIGGSAGVEFLAGCMTMELRKPHRYSEEISSVLVSKDGKMVVAITKDYHYIFSATSDVSAALQAPLQRQMTGIFGMLHVDSDGAVNLPYTLLLDPTSGPEERAIAIAAQFQVRGNEVASRGVLNGTRYRSGGIEARGEAVALNRKYEIAVHAEQGSAEKLGKALLTPITVAADGALMLVSLPLVVVYMNWVGVAERVKR